MRGLRKATSPFKKPRNVLPFDSRNVHDPETHRGWSLKVPPLPETRLEEEPEEVEKGVVERRIAGVQEMHIHRGGLRLASGVASAVFLWFFGVVGGSLKGTRSVIFCQWEVG